MTVRDLLLAIEAWAPPGVAWEKDNVGLQCGDPHSTVRGVLVALDATPEVVAEAVRRNANVIITHHPLVFRPLHRIDLRTTQGRMIESLLKHGMTLLSAHTNLDFSEGGTSHRLAELLGLHKLRFLHHPYRITKKIVTFVPADQVDTVAAAMAGEGAGVIGKYERCSFRSEGTGTFQGAPDTHPAVGRAGILERVAEVRLEMEAPQDRMERILSTLRSAHPYEEPAIDVYALETPTPRFGMGVIGEMPRPLRLAPFLRHVKRVLKSRQVRYVPAGNRAIRRVAVCGGAGSDLLAEAIRQKADVFVTADVKYHAFHDAAGAITLVDAGHFETEHPVVGAIVAYVKEEFRHRAARVPVHASTVDTNPVRVA